MPNDALAPGHVYLGDARQLAAMLGANSIDVTVTSPPYFDMKDYGTKNQIGFGQDYETYLTDLQGVFGHVLRATKPAGTLWIIIDTFRRNHEVYPLPFDVASRLKKIGWVLRDIIIWKKERTVPWVKAGATRKIFEYVLVFAKTTGHINYRLDLERDTSDLKRWWVKYPERYNPRGKALEEIWTYDIPTQGSWGKRFIRHFCPLPAALVSRIIRLTTKAGATVLDPFAGTGTVPASAKAEGRQFVGIELNRSYIAKFEQFIKLQEASKRSSRASPAKFERQILDLRTLKFGRLIYRLLLKRVRARSALQIFVRRSNKRSTEAYKICSADIYVLASAEVDAESLRKHFLSAIEKPPLSKFGIDATFSVVTSRSRLPNDFHHRSLYCYTSTNSHRYSDHLPIGAKTISRYPVVSPIRADVEVPDE